MILPGAREEIRPEFAAVANEARPAALPAARTNASWTHRAGDADHRLVHPFLPANLSLAFARDIGQGDTLRARVTADPVVANGRIFTLDSANRVTATGTNGATLWSRSITPPADGASDVSGGGLAISGSRLFVATAFGELVALDVATGGTLWRQDLDAPGGASPTVRGGLVYIVSRNSQAWAVEVDTGRVRWTLDGTPSLSNVSGGAGAATDGSIVIFPFPSGEVMGAFPEGGLRRWSTVVTGQRDGRAAATISDITSDPVIDGGRAYVSNFSGRLVALDAATGDRLWTSVEGAVSPVWPEGNSVYLVNDINELVRLDAATGEAIWRVRLPQFEESRERRRKTFFAHHGPVLAGGRLIVASSDGALRQFNPVNGALLSQTAIPGGATTNPVVAGGTLYLVSGTGQLLAFR